jgi:hypothetical protein
LCRQTGQKQLKEQQLIKVPSEMVSPRYAATWTEQVRAFFEHCKVVGIIGVFVMLFFMGDAIENNLLHYNAG